MLPYRASPGDTLSPPERHRSVVPRPSTALVPHGPQRGIAGGLHVLVVEDDDAVRNACVGVAQSLGCHVRSVDSLPAARDSLQQGPLDVVLLDVRLPGGTGTSLLPEMQAVHPHAYIAVMTSFASATAVADLMRSGARDFLQKPFALDQVSNVLTAASRHRQSFEASRSLRDRLEAGVAAGRLLGTSAPMQQLYRIISKVALTRHPVLILGETGSGKEVAARAIHANGPQPLSPFLAIDCDALEPERLERELFPPDSPETCQKASPEDGQAQPPAQHGALYLSEIQHLTPPVQARLNRALADRRNGAAVAPAALGGRLIASSSVDLETLVRQGRFRRDLYDRLNTTTLRIPPLRERPEDISLLAEYFLERERRERDLSFTLSAEALEAMLAYTWAGNVGELESAIGRACALATGPLLLFDDMVSPVKAHTQTTQAACASGAPAEEIQSLLHVEREAIRTALKICGGDKVEAAHRLGIGKTTLYRKLKDYDLAGEPGTHAH